MAETKLKEACVMQKTIFVVDDNDINLTVAKETLKNQYRVMTLPSGSRMFSLIGKVKPDLILLDIEMPEMDGFEALRLLKSNASQANIPVIFLTSMTDAAIEAKGFELGVVDFITKPFSAPVLLNRIKSHLNIDEIIRERTTKLRKLQNGIVFVLADMVENRDQNTGGHIERTSAYLKLLVEEALRQSVYEDEIHSFYDQDFELFITSARLHDVGKITISDIILNKPNKLTQSEFEVMKSHPSEGERIIDQIVTHAGESEAFLHHAKQFAGYHHERWDGTGYPHGLEEMNIPLQGRLMAFADVYDALVSARPYKKPFSHEEAVNIIMNGRGSQFDPQITDVFFSVENEFGCVRGN